MASLELFECKPLGARLTVNGCVKNQLIGERYARWVLGWKPPGGQPLYAVPTLDERGLSRLVACAKCDHCSAPDVFKRAVALMTGYVRDGLVRFESTRLERKTAEERRLHSKAYEKAKWQRIKQQRREAQCQKAKEMAAVAAQ
jgi:hypothetical protein